MKMREKWNKEEETPRLSDGQPIPQSFIALSTEPNVGIYRPKLLLKSPSMRAIKNYNNLSICEDNNSPNTYDNLTFIPENGNLDSTTMTNSNYGGYHNNTTASVVSSTNNTFISDSKNNSVFPNAYDMYDYTTTLGSYSVKTTTSNGSELDSEKNEMGSQTKLVSSKMGASCQLWFTHLATLCCTLSLAAGFGNLYRLQQAVLIHGGLPFLVAYIVLTVLVGLPLLFLELGIGQLAQEGFIKSWRAVPFFEGVGFVKLIAGCLLSIYYPLYMGLSLYYIIWLAKGSIPFPECAVVKLKETGYSANGIDGQQCLKKTFLESPLKDPYWYGIFAGILFVIWIIVTILSIRRTKSFIRSLSILLIPFLVCLVSLIAKSVFMEDEFDGLEKFAEEADWDLLKSANVWYFAAIQVFFSTNVGFGSFVTSAGIIYNKVNPFWTALGYIAVNLLFGVGSVLMCFILLGEMDVTPEEGQRAELHLISIIYTALTKNEDPEDSKLWAIVAYVTFVLSGFISMATLTYTLLKAITVQNKRRLKWWQTSIVLSFTGFVLSCAILLRPDFELVHLLDHYIAGNLILISVVIEILAMISFYGTERIKSDFEFMLGHILSNIWLVLWWIVPLLLTGIFVWALVTLPLRGLLMDDPEWLYGLGWAVVLTATVFIFIVGFFTVTRQDGYTFTDKFSASLKPSKKWGPKDPILRHNWIQWNSKAQQGERDFTLKRKGTREYTKSVKRNAKKAAAAAEGSAANTSTLERSTPTTVVPNHIVPNNIRTSNASSTEYAEPFYINTDAGVPTTENTRFNENDFIRTLRITSLEPPEIYNGNTVGGGVGYKTKINPLSRPHEYVFPDGSNSEGYGTFRKGPYIIPDGNIKHVCHRRYSQSEDATEL